MSKRRVYIIGLVVFLLLLTGCSKEQETDAYLDEIDALNNTINELNIKISQTEEAYQNRIDQLKEEKNIQENDIKALEEARKQIENTITEKKEEKATFEEKIRILENEKKYNEDYVKKFKVREEKYIDVLKTISNETKVLNEDEKVEWAKYLDRIIRFLPKFSSIEEISEEEIIESTYLYMVYTEDIFQYENKHDYITKSEMEKGSELILNHKIIDHKSTGLLTYKDEKYYPNGFSYHGSFFPYIKEIYIKEDLIVIKAIVYRVYEDDWVEKYDSFESVLYAIETKDNAPQLLGEYFVVLKTNPLPEVEYSVESIIELYNMYDE